MWPLGKDEKKFKKIMNAKGKQLIDQPYLEEFKIRPDFYSPKDDVYYEVVSNRQAYLSKAAKIKDVKKKGIRILVVNPDGTLYKNMIVKKIRRKGKGEDKSFNLMHIDHIFWGKVKYQCTLDGTTIRAKIITLLEEWLSRGAE